MLLRIVVLAGLLLALVAAPAQADSGALWAFADQRASELNRYWNSALGRYQLPDNAVHVNATLLALHARAALVGHAGAARQDARLVPLADRLSRWPVYIEDPAEASGGGQSHVPGFASEFDKLGGQHVSFDMQIMNALALSYQTGLLPETLAERLRVRLQAVADHAVFRYPSIALNQMNWQLQVQTSAARVNNSWSQAASEARNQLQRFVAGMHQPMPGQLSPNLSRGLGLFYLPGQRRSHFMNRVSTSEYANIIYAGLDVYQPLLDHGMAPLDDDSEGELRRWAQRLLQGDWTHAGWLNWDSGYGLKRWQLQRYWAWSAEALVTMASSERLAGAPERAWASWLFARLLQRYDWLAVRRQLGSTRYAVTSSQAHHADAQLTAARLANLAARAATSPMAEPTAPGGWSWWDEELHRLAVSGPAYSAAIVAPINTPRYGGLEPSRLLDSQGRVLTSLGADGRQAGLALYRRGRLVASSQAQSEADGRRLGRWQVQGAGGEAPRLFARSGELRVVQQFSSHGLRTRYRLPGRSQAVLRLPLWGLRVRRQLHRRAGLLTLQTINEEGARLRVELRLPAGARLRWQHIGASEASPRTRLQLVVRWQQQSPGQASVTYRPLS